jgi:hypothetical protein
MNLFNSSQLGETRLLKAVTELADRELEADSDGPHESVSISLVEDRERVRIKDYLTGTNATISRADLLDRPLQLREAQSKAVGTAKSGPGSQDGLIANLYGDIQSLAASNPSTLPPPTRQPLASPANNLYRFRPCKWLAQKLASSGHRPQAWAVLHSAGATGPFYTSCYTCDTGDLAQTLVHQRNPPAISRSVSEPSLCGARC